MNGLWEKGMNGKIFKTILGASVFAWALSAQAAHGPDSSIVREGWVNSDLESLIDAGWVTKPSKPVEQMTNMEVAELTSEAAGRLAQADLSMPPALPEDPGLPGLPEPTASTPPSPALPEPLAGNSVVSPTQADASKSAADLVAEFSDEIAKMGVNVDQLEDRLIADKNRNETFADLQKAFLKRTGTDISGLSRGYINNYRGFGKNAIYPPMDYNALLYMEMDLKSVPVPFVLFDARMRFWRSIGMYFQDPVPNFDLRWLSLSNYNEFATVTVGDFYKSYTPLTLWNNETPLYTLIEPTSFHRARKDVEELVFMDHEPDYRMKGLQASTSVAWPNSDILSLFKLHAMVGSLKDASSFTFGSYYAGSQSSLSFFNNNFEVAGTGLLLWQDPNSGDVPYLPDFPSTFAKQLSVGSWSSRVNIPFASDVSIAANGEGAFSSYNDDSNDPSKVFQDWAYLIKGSINVGGVHLKAHYVNNGPFFYSPGAQTNHFTAGPGPQGYLSDSGGKDDALPGYLDDFVFQDLGRPSFAIYDRLSENMMPYGDATPNREGLILGLDAEFGKGGWLKPQFVYVPTISGLQMREIQPNLVVNSSGAGWVPVENGNNFEPPVRLFGGYEGALSVDLAKALEERGTYKVAFDYKHQTTDLQLGGPLFTADTLIAAADFTVPFKPIKSVVWSAAFEQVQSTGEEYTLTGQGAPPTLAQYPFALDSGSVGAYSLQDLNLTKTTLAFGLLYPFSDKINFRVDWFRTDYSWKDQPSFDSHEQIWRFTYETRF